MSAEQPTNTTTGGCLVLEQNTLFQKSPRIEVKSDDPVVLNGVKRITECDSELKGIADWQCYYKRVSKKESECHFYRIARIQEMVHFLEKCHRSPTTMAKVTMFDQEINYLYELGCRKRHPCDILSFNDKYMMLFHDILNSPSGSGEACVIPPEFYAKGYYCYSSQHCVYCNGNYQSGVTASGSKPAGLLKASFVKQKKLDVWAGAKPKRGVHVKRLHATPRVADGTRSSCKRTSVTVQRKQRHDF